MNHFDECEICSELRQKGPRLATFGPTGERDGTLEGAYLEGLGQGMHLAWTAHAFEGTDVDKSVQSSLEFLTKHCENFSLDELKPSWEKEADAISQ